MGKFSEVLKYKLSLSSISDHLQGESALVIVDSQIMFSKR